MFTNKKTVLSELVASRSVLCKDLDVRRDFMFAYVGKIASKLDDRLIGVSKLKHLEELEKVSGVSGVLATPDLAKYVPSRYGLAVCDLPYPMAMDIHEYIASIPGFQWADFDTDIHESANVHASAVIAPRNVRIGAGCSIGPNVVICERVIIGEYSSIGPGSIIGYESFDLKAGVTPQRLIRQSGGVKLAKRVHIKANVTIDRATFGGFTECAEAVVIDNLSYLAHDCYLGAEVRVASAVSINGRVHIGANSYIGPNAVITNGIDIGAGSNVSLGSVVTRSVECGGSVTGNFALPHAKWLRFIKSIR